MDLKTGPNIKLSCTVIIDMIYVTGPNMNFVRLQVNIRHLNAENPYVIFFLVFFKLLV